MLSFFSMCTVFVARTLQVVQFASFQSLDPYLLKILDARLCTCSIIFTYDKTNFAFTKRKPLAINFQ